MCDRNANVRKTGSNCWPLIDMPVAAVKAVVETKELLDRLFRDISTVAWQRYDRETCLDA